MASQQAADHILCNKLFTHQHKRMTFSFLHLNTKRLKDQAVEDMLFPIHEPLHNTSEGSEFLDDGLRMADLQRIHTEESISAGSPENLL